MCDRLLLVLLLVPGVCFLIADGTPLDDYVNTPDCHYTWNALEWKYKGEGYTLHLVNMTSQKWLTENEVDRPVWFHYIVIAVPDVIVHRDTAFMYISGGHNEYEYTPDLTDHFVSFISMMAVSTGTVTANLRQIPNQPLYFKNDPQYMRRSEDAIIAWTWRMFMDNPSKPEWLLRLPMTKGSVRAMDTISAFAKTVKSETDIKKFVVCGESKRGWTTWTTAAVDKRVIAISPIVMDLLNMVKNLHHHYRSLGGWTFEFYNYYQENITTSLDDKVTQQLADIVDPYSYLDRLTMPKYIVTASGDEFFIPDDSYYYLNNLPGENYLRVIPNADHSLTGHRVSLFLGMRTFYLSVLENINRPNITWNREVYKDGGRITVYTDRKPDLIRYHYATTMGGSRRDFRLAIADPNNPSGSILQPVIWKVDAVKKKSDTEYTVYQSNPVVGWKAYFIEMTFKGPGRQ
ncbi:autocrine proliferation repressor protein A-like [Gigantopelta aegis]|uniref:autocrine proliferation repressor protein A-like n=1 Tax=Gigantopelta aegis TaxID=1735272 RepID=UPI001B889AA8|nr:autocrine proliferation repressor protein A-like [Gigantopelta aegis]